MRRSSITEKGVQAERWAIHLGYLNGLRGDALGRFAKEHADSDSTIVIKWSYGAPINGRK